MKTIILASTSPRRKALLAQIGFKFIVVPSNYEEKLNPRLKSRGQAEFLAKQKARIVAEKYAGLDVLVIGADQVMDFQGETLGKPKSPLDAKRMLARMSGKVHTAITAFTIIDVLSKRIETKSVETKVFMRNISKKEIDSYVATGEPMDRAGAYAISERGAVFVKKIEGDFFNVVGMPLHAVTEELKRFGVSIF